jgi:hypothetical protein
MDAAERYAQRSLFPFQTVFTGRARIQSRMAYIVIKTIKGRQYRYQQRTYRQGRKVRTDTIYLGPVDGGTRGKGIIRRIGAFIDANRMRRHGLPDEQTIQRQSNEKVSRDREAREKAIDQLHVLYGLKMPSTQTSTASDHQGKTPSEKGANEINTPMPASE